MPLLDVSEVILDPEFAEQITVLRRPIVMVAGRATSPKWQRYCVPAVVNSGVSALDRANGDQQSMPNKVSVHTLFRLQGPAPGYQPDYVVWRDDNYIVTSLDDYSRYGAGFTRADCASVDSIDSPPDIEDMDAP